MKKSVLVLVSLILLISYSCLEDENNEQTDQYNEELIALHASLDEIVTLADQSICGDDFNCKFIALGEKACGGPKTYLLYSTSIDTTNLESMVETFNIKDKEFNLKWDGVSDDCAVVTAPDSTSCVDGKCVAIYDN